MTNFDELTSDEQLAELSKQGAELHETVHFAGQVDNWEDHPETGFGEDEPEDQQSAPDAKLLAAWQADVKSEATELGFDEWQEAQDAG